MPTNRIFPRQIPRLAVIEPDSGEIAFAGRIVKIDHDRMAFPDLFDQRDPAVDIAIDHQDLGFGSQEFPDRRFDHFIRFPYLLGNRGGADALHGISGSDEFGQDMVVAILGRTAFSPDYKTGEFFVGVRNGIPDQGPDFAVPLDQTLFAKFLQVDPDGVSSGS